MPQSNESGRAVAFPAVPDVRKDALDLTPRDEGSAGTNGQLARLAHIRTADVIQTASCRPEAT
jgi:hypothetical protein